MFLKRLQLVNFQSHKNSIINFDSFNLIVGENNAGKTAISRALLFLIFNVWDNSYLRSGTNKCLVKADFDVGTIYRIKGKEVNKIILIKDNKLLKFENFGKTYPKEILSFFGCVAMKLDSKAIPIFLHEQDLNFFFLNLQPSQRNKFLNLLFNIEKLSKIYNSFKKDINNLNEDVEKTDTKIKILEKDIQEFDKIISEKEDLLLKKQIVDHYLETERILSELQQFKEKYSILSTYDIKILDKILQIIDLLTIYLNCKEILSNIHRLESELTGLEKQLNGFKKICSNIENCPFLEQ